MKKMVIILMIVQVLLIVNGFISIMDNKFLFGFLMILFNLFFLGMNVITLRRLRNNEYSENQNQ
jgi:hypothetical protein